MFYYNANINYISYLRATTIGCWLDTYVSVEARSGCSEHSFPAERHEAAFDIGPIVEVGEVEADDNYAQNDADVDHREEVVEVCGDSHAAGQEHHEGDDDGEGENVSVFRDGVQADGVRQRCQRVVADGAAEKRVNVSGTGAAEANVMRK